jgi:RNA polymerase sigma factor (TIGR02999 family)
MSPGAARPAELRPIPEQPALSQPQAEPTLSLNEIDLAVLYPELKRIARQRMRGEREDHTLQPTALVNELWLQLLRRPDFSWSSRGHFLLYASCAMRHLLVDYARQRQADKRAAGDIRIDLGDIPDTIGLSRIDRIIDIDEALTDLAQIDQRRARVVELRFFAGLNFQEIGETLGVTDRTAKRDWALAEEWLERRLKGMQPSDKPDEEDHERRGMGEG